MAVLDVTRYRRFVERINASDADKDEMILVVSRIMQDCVDRAWGDHPVQQCHQISQENVLSPNQEHARLLAYSTPMKQAKPSGILGGPR